MWVCRKCLNETMGCPIVCKECGNMEDFFDDDEEEE